MKLLRKLPLSPVQVTQTAPFHKVQLSDQTVANFLQCRKDNLLSILDHTRAVSMKHSPPPLPPPFFTLLAELKGG